MEELYDFSEACGRILDFHNDQKRIMSPKETRALAAIERARESNQ